MHSSQAEPVTHVCKMVCKPNVKINFTLSKRDLPEQFQRGSQRDGVEKGRMHREWNGALGRSRKGISSGGSKLVKGNKRRVRPRFDWSHARLVIYQSRTGRLREAVKPGMKISLKIWTASAPRLKSSTRHRGPTKNGTNKHTTNTWLNWWNASMQSFTVQSISLDKVKVKQLLSTLNSFFFWSKDVFTFKANRSTSFQIVQTDWHHCHPASTKCCGVPDSSSSSFCSFNWHRHMQHEGNTKEMGSVGWLLAHLDPGFSDVSRFRSCVMINFCMDVCMFACVYACIHM